MKISYKSVFVYTSNGITAYIPACPGCVVGGSSDASTKSLMAEKLEIWCSMRLISGEELPPDFTSLEMNKWIQAHKPFWKKDKWAIKTINTNMEA